MRGLGASLFADSVQQWERTAPRRGEKDKAARCDFCRSAAARWHHPAQQGGDGWKACLECHLAILADDRRGLRRRSLTASAPATFPYRYTPKLRQRARRLSEDFWRNRAGIARPLRA